MNWKIQRPQVRAMIIGFGKTKCFGNTKGQVEMKLDRPNSQEISTTKGMGGLAVSLIADTQRQLLYYSLLGKPNSNQF
jgi:hypothetical protein